VQVANPNDSLQGSSSGRKILENSVPHSNDNLSVQLMHGSLLIFFERILHTEDKLLHNPECRLNTTETTTLLWKLAHCKVASYSTLFFVVS